MTFKAPDAWGSRVISGLTQWFEFACENSAGSKPSSSASVPQADGKHAECCAFAMDGLAGICMSVGAVLILNEHDCRSISSNSMLGRSAFA